MSEANRIDRLAGHVNEYLDRRAALAQADGDPGERSNRMNGRLEHEPNFYRPPQFVENWRAAEHAASLRETLKKRLQRNVTLNGIAAGAILTAVTVYGGNIIRAALHLPQWAWIVR